METRAVRAALVSLVAFALAAPEEARCAWTMHVIDNQARGADGVRVRDVNADGLPDVVTGFEEGGVVKLYVHPGRANVRKAWPAIVVGRVSDPEDAVAMDVDGDGRYEIISSTERANQKLYVHRYTGSSYPGTDGEWTTTAIPASSRQDSLGPSLCGYRAFAYAMKLLGLHHFCWRGRMPQRWMYTLPLERRTPAAFMAASKEHNASITLFARSAAADSAWIATPLASVGWVMSLIEFDFDQDSDADVVYSDRRGADLDGNGRFDDGIDPAVPGTPRRGVFALESANGEWVKRVIVEVDAEVMFMDVGDLDGDGLPDIVAATKAGYVLWLRGLGRGRYEARKIPVPPDASDLKSVAVGDIDGDGQSDLVLAVESAKADAPRVYGILLDKISKQARTVVDIAGRRGQKFDRVELLDLDGDGDLDVLTTEEVEDLGVVWFENPAKSQRLPLRR
jgi:hypothetical protein